MQLPNPQAPAWQNHHSRRTAHRPGRSADKFGQKSLNGKQQKSIAIRNRRAVIPNRNRRAFAQLQPPQHGGDIALMRYPLRIPQAPAERGEVHRPRRRNGGNTRKATPSNAA
jgi:hypothetical protein